MYKTNRDLTVNYPQHTPCSYAVPAGTRLERIERGRHTPGGYIPRYIVAEPRGVGVECSHDLLYHTMDVPDDAVVEVEG